MSGFSELAQLGLRVRPLTQQLPDPTYGGSTTSPFSAGWSETVELLAREVSHLQPREVILEAGFTETQLRQDGLPRASARPFTEGVILTLVGTPHGDLRYPCSTFWDWQSNVRAIALALEALRKVDRYGVTKRGEQYQGWKQLTAGGPDASRGQQLISRLGGMAAALRATHPDTRDPDGPYTDADFADVQAARKELGRG